MHILLIHQYFLDDNDGGGSRWNEMARIWINEGHQVTVLAGMEHYLDIKLPIYRGKYFLRQTNCNGVHIIRCFVADAFKAGFLRRVWSQSSFAFSATWAAAFLAKDKYDVVICSSPPLFVGVVGLIASWIKRIDFILEIRDLWPQSAIETGVLVTPDLIKASFWLEKFLYRRAKAINVLTPAFREVLINQKNVQASKIWLVPNAADFAFREKLEPTFDKCAVRRTLGLDDRFVIVYTGAHGIANDLRQIIHAAALLKDTWAHFVLVGDGPMKQQLILETGLRSITNVTFLRTVSKAQVFKYILAADAGISVLKKAKIFKTVYSNKTFDYFACGKPVLMAIDGVSRELIEEADAGLFVEPDNPQDLAEKVKMYLTNPLLVQRHGRNGYAHAKKFYDREVLAREYLQYIENMLKTRSKRKRQ